MTMDRAPDRWACVDGHWCHRPRWKVLFNTVLSAMQPRREHKLVVFSLCEDGDGPSPRPRCVGYGVGPVLHSRAT